MHELILYNVSRHISLEEEEKEYFISLLKPRLLQKKEYLLQAGENCRYENFVVKGLLRAYTVDYKGHEHIAMFAMEDFFAIRPSGKKLYLRKSRFDLPEGRCHQAQPVAG